ncbi:hydrogen peroxide-inducible genes activator [Oricola indica]|uniref:hydrogen peroxide-inducible genes activator n=1 Tax=Oricola indica TaxID=2872591 RepID=UPI003CCBE501
MPFRPSPRQLEYLLAVIETGHFREAARLCNVSQPTLSAQLQLLEDQLGAALIDRTPGRSRATPIGEKVAVLARTTLTSLDEIVAVARQSTGQMGGLVRLGVAPTFGPYYLPRLLPHLHDAYPDLEIYIREDRAHLLEASVMEGTIDCALGPQPEERSRLDYLELMVEPLYLGMASRHRLAAAGEVRIEMLAGERMLTLGSGHRLSHQVRALSAQSGAVMREEYEGTSLDALRQMVSIGMGLSLFPELYAASEFARREEQVVLRRIADLPLARSVGLLWRKDHVRASHFASFGAACRRIAETIGTPRPSSLG